MKQIRRDKTFEKHFKQRISTNKNLTKRFRERLQLFMDGKLNYPLNDHSLTGQLEGKRAFSIAGDIRVIYVEFEDFIVFLDVDSHNQVYK